MGRVAQLRVRGNDKRPLRPATHIILAPFGTRLLFANASDLVGEGNKEELLQAAGDETICTRSHARNKEDKERYLKKSQLRGRGGRSECHIDKVGAGGRKRLRHNTLHRRVMQCNGKRLPASTTLGVLPASVCVLPQLPSSACATDDAAHRKQHCIPVKGMVVQRAELNIAAFKPVSTELESSQSRH